MSGQLKPCPFCGGKVKIKKISDDEGFCWFAIVKEPGDGNCTCHASMESTVFPDDEPEERIEKIRQELIEAWNARHERTCHLNFSVVDEAGGIYGEPIICDACGYEMSWTDFPVDIPNYCPGCGAKVVA